MEFRIILVIIIGVVILASLALWRGWGMMTIKRRTDGDIELETEAKNPDDKDDSTIDVGSDQEMLPAKNISIHVAYNATIELSTIGDITGIKLDEDSGDLVTLFYGTNRNRTNSKELNEFYGNELTDLKLGLCEVSIPKNHRLGVVERPFSLWKFEFPENDKKHVVINNLKELNENEYFSFLVREFEKRDQKAGLIFIHGYNCTFAQAARRAGQIAHDLPFNGLAGFFSWPSAGKFKFYGSDIEHADASILDFEKFLTNFISRTGVEYLHMIAHSMGNRILATCLSNLSKNLSFKTQLKKIQQIVLAAPDIDQEVFKKNILPYINNVGTRRTLYASDGDKALAFSELLRIKRPRLGDGGNSIFVSNYLDTIDASNIKAPGFMDHSYMFETRALITDLNHLINNNLDPKRRSLKKREKGNLPYWLFPK